MKYMKMFFTAVLLLTAVFMLTSCGNSAQHDILLELSGFAKEQYESGRLEKGNIINRDNIADYVPENSDIYNEINQQAKYYKLAMLDENTVIIQTHVVFQSVSGYVVSYGTETENGWYDVPTGFGYDADKIKIQLLMDRSDDVFIYSFSAGL